MTASTKTAANTTPANKTKETFVKRVKKERKAEMRAYQRACRCVNRRIRKAAKNGYSHIEILCCCKSSSLYDTMKRTSIDCLAIVAIASILCGVVAGGITISVLTGCIGALIGGSIVAGIAFAVASKLWKKKLDERSYTVRLHKIEPKSLSALIKKQEEDGYKVKAYNNNNDWYELRWISRDDVQQVREFTDPAMYDAYMRGVPADDILA